MNLRWLKRKPPVYALPKPKQITVTVEEVAALLALVAVMSDEFTHIADDPEIQNLVEKARMARDYVHKGHRVSIFVPFGDMQ